MTSSQHRSSESTGDSSIGKHAEARCMSSDGKQFKTFFVGVFAAAAACKVKKRRVNESKIGTKLGGIGEAIFVEYGGLKNLKESKLS